MADATKREYKPESFDVIYSRDTILHIPDKLALFKKFYVSISLFSGLLFNRSEICYNLLLLQLLL